MHTHAYTHTNAHTLTHTVDNQAVDRAYRIGQQRDVVVSECVCVSFGMYE